MVLRARRVAKASRASSSSRCATERSLCRRSSNRPLEALLQHLVNGLVLGGTYALLGIGLTLIFGLMNVVNFAHGEFYTLGAYTAFATSVLLGLPFLAAIPAAIVVGIVLGALCERVLLRPLRGESIDSVM